MNSRNFRLLVLNPGSTSTKIAVFDNDKELKKSTVKHPPEEIQNFKSIWDQYDYRKRKILDWVRENNFKLDEIDAVVSRGGTINSVPSGIYLINSKMLEDMKSGKYGKHACNVGCQINYDLGKELNIPSITVDPPVTNELMEIATYTGLPQIRRKASFHVLNQKAIARKLAADLNKKYEDMDCIIVHLGGGISVGTHSKGRIIDANNALDGDGSFSPERAGDLPVGDLIKLCFSGQYSEEEMLKMISGGGGLVAHLGTTDGLVIEERINKGDAKAKEVIEAMAYNVSKEIGAASTALYGKVEAIALTGGLAHWERLVGLIKERIEFLAPVYVYPGEDEMGSLAQGALRYLRGEEECKEY
ncbi:MAG: butyrate kinase [Clostridiaceae bacterium]|nr:butyrate kinase [Clostridiaceae bacterium]